MLSNYDQVQKRSASKAPISTHPAFPAIIALWFAALLGIGSLIVPVILFERISAITGLSAVVPSAQAPLGFTARGIIALVAAGSGIVIGLFLARKVAAAQPGIDTSHFAKDKLPISAMEELGAQSLDQPVDECDLIGPLAGPVAGFEAERFTDSRPSMWTTGDPAMNAIDAPVADLLREEITSRQTGTEFESAPKIVLKAAVEPAAEQSQAVVIEAPTECSEDDAADLSRAEEPAQFGAPQTVAPSDQGMTAEQLISRPLAELGIVQLVERFALSLQQRSTSAAIDYGDPLGGAFDDQDGAQDGNLGEMDWQTAFAGPAEAGPDHGASELQVEPEQESADDEFGEAETGALYSSLLAIKKIANEPRKIVDLPANRTSDSAETGAVLSSQESDRGPHRFNASVAVLAADMPPSSSTKQADTERSLRDALETLQKMSGVG